MRRILILADDLSGAADCANACMHSGLSAVVSIDGSEHALESDVLAIDCDTRHLSAEQAFTRVAKVMRAHVDDTGGQLIFKKIDSTLRGNVGAEIRAALEVQRTWGTRAVAVLAPAFPACGRTTINGHQLAHGVSLHEAEMWRNDALPGTAHIPTMLEEAGLRTAAFNLGTVRRGPDDLSSAMRRLSAGADVMICDAETDEDLRTVAHASRRLGAETVWAGSAGLAYQLPFATDLAGTPPTLPKFPCMDGPMLFVVGSMSGVSHRQAAMLEREAPIRSVRLCPWVLLQGNAASAWTDLADRVTQSIERGEDTLVMLDPAERVNLYDRRLLTDAVGLMLSPFAGKVRALAATGGETARAILSAWNVPSLKIVGEVQSGIPCSTIEIGGSAIPVLTKAGGFGDEDALLLGWQCLANLLGRQKHVALRETT